MSWTDFDWKQPRPVDVTLDQLWERIEIRPEKEIHALVETYLSEMRSICVNGGALYARFRLVSHPDFHWYAMQRRWSEIEFVPRFFSHSVVAQELGQLVAAPRADMQTLFESRSAFTLDGELASNLVFGGAYEAFKGTPRQAKDLAGDVCAALFADRFLDVDVLYSPHPWSSWFFDIAWDSTHLVIDRRTCTVHVLASTDTD